MKHLLRIFLISLVALFALSPTAQGLGLDSGSISALDTVAGFETMVSLNGFSRQKTAVLKIQRPDGSGFTKHVLFDASGKAQEEISGDETKIAGTYQVSVEPAGVQAVFEVFPGDMDPERSGVYASKAFAGANGADAVNVYVKITDEFGNSLKFHEVSLTSSRSSDRIVAVSSPVSSDEKGLVSFRVFSSQAGVSTLTATDETAITTVKERLKVVFFRSAGVAKAVGGDPETLLLAQSDAPVARFEIVNLSATLAVNETTNFRVKAVDASGVTINSYAGTVLFSSTDPHAQLPNAYTFTPSDQGQHTFDLGLSFRTPGTQKLTVQQQGNALIQGEKTVTVVSQASPSTGPVRITKPATGTYSLKVLEVAGEAAPNARVKLFDNGQQMSEVQANSSGRFSFTTPLLTDGQHVFYALSNGVQSESVTATLDSTPAQVEQFDITKTNLAPGETVEISLRSDPDLTSVQATVGDFITDLEGDPGNPGIYRGTLTAPSQDGEYPINVIITDRVGNVSPATEVSKIRVDAGFQPAPAPSFTVPSKVSGVAAQPRNAAVRISWYGAQAASGIAHYRIYYGRDPTSINLVVNTADAKTESSVSGLQNGTKYYFQVAGVDTNGNEGDTRSEVVSATPSADAAGSDSDSPVLCDPEPCPEAGPPPYTPEDGPEVVGMIVAALLGAGAIRFVRRKK